MKIEDMIGSAGSIGISGHERPDGDCVGACMALYLYCKKNMPEKEVTVFLEQPKEEFFCIKDTEEICSDFSTEKEYDCFIVLDCEPGRTGDAVSIFERAKKQINIDHHISNQSACEIQVVKPDASSACEVLYDLLDPEKLDVEIAKALYIGIIHDTGVLKYSNTAPHTLRIVADLIGYGFDFPKLIDETFYEKGYAQNRLTGKAVLDSVLHCNGKCISTTVSKADMEAFGVSPKELDGVVNQLRVTKGVEVAIFLYEMKENTYKVSLRSNGLVNVSRVAACFGGGGHVRAAGATMEGTPETIIAGLIEEIQKEL